VWEIYQTNVCQTDCAVDFIWTHFNHYNHCYGFRNKALTLNACLGPCMSGQSCQRCVWVTSSVTFYWSPLFSDQSIKRWTQNTLAHTRRCSTSAERIATWITFDTGHRKRTAWLLPRLNSCCWVTNIKFLSACCRCHSFPLSSLLTLILLTWRIGWAPNNASKWQMGFNSAFKGLYLRLWKIEWVGS